MKAEIRRFLRQQVWVDRRKDSTQGCSRPEGIPAVPSFGESKKKKKIKINKDEIMSNKAKCHLFQFYPRLVLMQLPSTQ